MSVTRSEVLQIYKKSLQTLSARARRKYIFVTCIQSGIGFLDVAGVAMLGALGAVAIRGEKNQAPGSLIKNILKTLNIQDLGYHQQLVVLALLSILFLSMKTFISVIYTKRILLFLAYESSNLSNKILRLYIKKILGIKDNRPIAEMQYIVSTGTSQISIGVLGTTSNLISDGVLFIALSTGIFIIDPWTAFITLILFGSVALLTHKLIANRVSRTGLLSQKYNVVINSQINELLAALKEVYLRNGQMLLIENIFQTKTSLSNNMAEQSFLPNVSKYIFEIATTTGGFLVALIQFAIHDTAHAVAGLTVFIAAGSRLAPAVMRIQQSYMQVRSSAATAQSTLALIDELDLRENLIQEKFEYSKDRKVPTPDIKIDRLKFRFADSNEYNLELPELFIERNTMAAIVGPSGAGKTTLISLLIGLLEPSSGEVKIGEWKPSDFIKAFPGAISIVPQEVFISNDSIENNIFLGLPMSERSHERAISALLRSGFATSKNEAIRGLKKLAGENGRNLSGGEKQRVGIARALYTNPQILILDEATSALDGSMEQHVMESLGKLKGEITVLAIAHRLSTVKNADLVLYLEEGKLRAKGSIASVRELVPEFDNQARRMGLI